MRLVKQTNKPQRAHVIRLLAPLSLLAFAFIGAYANAQVAPQNPAPNPPTNTAGPTPSPASAPNKSKYSRICTENERMWCLQQHIGQKASQEMKRQCPENYKSLDHFKQWHELNNLKWTKKLTKVKKSAKQKEENSPTYHGIITIDYTNFEPLEFQIMYSNQYKQLITTQTIILHIQ